MQKQRTLLSLLCLLALPAAHAADVALGSTSWTSTGSTGLISSTYNPGGQDAQLGSSPTGNTVFGYVSTAFQWGATNDEGLPTDLGFAAEPVYNVSPLVLNDTFFDTNQNKGVKPPAVGGLNQTNGARVVSGSFSALAGERLTLHFNYVSTDGREYLDYAWARLVSASTQQTAAWLFTARSARQPDAGANDGDYVPGKLLPEQVGFDDLDSKDPNRKIAAVLNGGQPVIGMQSDNTMWAPLGPSAGQCWDVGTSCGSTGWVQSEYVVAQSASYYLEIGVSNWGDTALQSALAFDFVGLSQPAFGAVNLIGVPAAAPVPEPAAWSLMLAGLAVAGPWARRRRAGSR